MYAVFQDEDSIVQVITDQYFCSICKFLISKSKLKALMMISVKVFEHLSGGELYERIVECTDKVRNEF